MIVMQFIARAFLISMLLFAYWIFIDYLLIRAREIVRLLKARRKAKEL